MGPLFSLPYFHATGEQCLWGLLSSKNQYTGGCETTYTFAYAINTSAQTATFTYTPNNTTSQPIVTSTTPVRCSTQTVEHKSPCNCKLRWRLTLPWL